MATYQRATFSLPKAYKDKLKQIAERMRRTASQEVRIMINKRAIEVGLEPVEKDRANG